MARLIATIAMAFVLAVPGAGAGDAWRMGDNPGRWRDDDFAAAKNHARSTTLLCGVRTGYITSPALDFPASAYESAEVYYYRKSDGNILYFQFSPGQPDDLNPHTHVVSMPVNERHKPAKLVVSLKSRDDWKGTINRLRLALPPANEGVELTLLGIALRRQRDWLENGSFVATREDGGPWGWELRDPDGAFASACEPGNWTLRAKKGGSCEIVAELPHIREGLRYRAGVNGGGNAKLAASVRLYGQKGAVIDEWPLAEDGEGGLRLEYEATGAHLSGELVIRVQAERSGQQVRLSEAFLENLGSRGQWLGEWIWADANPQPEQTCHFRHEFEVDDPGRYASAFLQAACDDQFGIHINGHRVASHNNWREVQLVDVLDRIRPGKNVLYARGHNLGGAAGFLAELRLDPKDGSAPVRIGAGPSWLATLAPSMPGAENVDYVPDPAVWKPAHSFGPPPAPPWGAMTLRESAPPPRPDVPVDRERIASERLAARINNDLGYPRLELNGRVEHPLLFAMKGNHPQSYLDSARGGFTLTATWWEFSDAWRRDGALDFSALDRDIEECLRVNPGARVLIRFRVTSPAWWMLENPDAMCLYSDGSTDGAGYGLLPSMASDVWLEAVEKRMELFIDHVERAWYASRVAGYMPSSHSGPEWVVTRRSSALADYSKPMQRYFRDFLRQRYDGDARALRAAWNNPAVDFDTAEIPSMERRAPAEPWWLDPKHYADVADYNRAHSRSVGDAIMRVMRVVRARAPDKLTLVYYGYPLTLAQLYHCPQNTGHYDLERVLASGLVDVFVSPISYGWRNPGDISGSGTLQDSFRRRGVLWLQEADIRSSLVEDADPHKYNRNPRDSALENRREFAYALVNRLGLWYYDMGGGWYNHPVYTDDFRRMHELYRDAMEIPTTYQAPTAVFFDEQALDFTSTRLPDSGNSPRIGLYDFQRGLARSGQPYEVLAFSDVYDIDPERYKMLVFVNAVRPDERFLKHVREKLDRPGLTLVFLQAPGLAGGVDFASALTGMKLAAAKPGVAMGFRLTREGGGPLDTGFPGMIPPLALRVADTGARPLAHYADRSVAAASKTLPGGGRSVFAAMAENSGALWRALLKEQGVAPLIDARDRVLFDGRHFAVAAMDAPGPRRISLPVSGRVVEMFDGAEVAADARDFTVTLRPGDVLLVRVEPRE